MGGGGGGRETDNERENERDRERERERDYLDHWSHPFVVIRTSMWHLYEFSLSTRQLPFQRVCGPNKKRILFRRH